jgi:hypothetical protein
MQSDIQDEAKLTALWDEFNKLDAERNKAREAMFRTNVPGTTQASTPVAGDKSLLEKVFSGPAYDKYSAERTRAYTESPSKFDYDLAANKAAGEFIQGRVQEALGDNIVGKTVGALGTAAAVPIAALASPFHEAVQVVKEGRMEPGSGITGFTKAFLDEKPFSTAAQRAGGVLQSVPFVGKGIENIGAGVYNLQNKIANLRKRGIDERMARSYKENIQAMADPRMRGAKGGLAKVLGV